MFWEMLNREFPEADSAPFMKIAESAFKDRGIIPLGEEEGLKFGEDKGATSYNKFADVSLSKGYWSSPVNLAGKQLEDGQIVMTIWPESERILPAKVSYADKRVWLELPESQKKGDRCFVLDDKDASLLTVSFASDGGEKVAAMNPNVLTSWLCATGSMSMRKMSGRFGVNHLAGGHFVIVDNEKGQSYRGTIASHPVDIDNFELEKARLERLLASKGLGAVLPLYILKRA